MEGNILRRIVRTKIQEVESMKRVIDFSRLKDMAADVTRRPLSMKRSIKRKAPGIIAEHKRRSPSRGDIFPQSNVMAVAEAYAESGAAAMSVLTDTVYFGGSLEDLASARVAAPGLPLLRKEFIVSDYQIYQARVYGADAILLIAAILDKDELIRLTETAHRLGLETLVELHNTEELQLLPEDADMVGINNRDLNTFVTDISHSSALVEELPEGMVKIAESGIKSAEDILTLRRAGFDGFLIGEALMSQGNPGGKLRDIIKVCRNED